MKKWAKARGWIDGASIVRSLFISFLEIHLLPSFKFTFLLLLVSALPHVGATTLACPELDIAVQVGVCPTEEQLKYTFTGYCSDTAKAYAGETDVCTDYQLYRKMKNTVLWESADGEFDAYVSCDLPKESLQGAKVAGVKVAKKGKQTQLVCSYAEGVNFIHRTRAVCQLETTADCSAHPESCKASCN